MAQLTESLKVEIVQRLARFQPPAEIARQLREDYALEVGIPQIVGYDPTRPSFEAGQRFVEIFNITREAFIKNVDAVPIANQGYRLQVLQSLLENHLKHKKLPEAARVVEQAAKEMGGLYAAIDKSRAAEPPKESEPLATEEERKAKLAGLMDAAIANMKAKATAPASDARQ